MDATDTGKMPKKSKRRECMPLKPVSFKTVSLSVPPLLFHFFLVIVVF